MKTCEEYVIERLNFAESRMHSLEDNYRDLEEMYTCRLKDLEFLLSFFRKDEYGDTSYYQTDPILEKYDKADFSRLTDLIEKFGKEEPLEP